MNVVKDGVFLDREVGVLHLVCNSILFTIQVLVVGLLVVLGVKADAVDEFSNLGLGLAVRFLDALLEAKLEDLTTFSAWLIKEVKLARIIQALHEWKVCLDDLVN